MEKVSMHKITDFIWNPTLFFYNCGEDNVLPRSSYIW